MIHCHFFVFFTAVSAAYFFFPSLNLIIFCRFNLPLLDIPHPAFTISFSYLFIFTKGVWIYYRSLHTLLHSVFMSYFTLSLPFFSGSKNTFTHRDSTENLLIYIFGNIVWWNIIDLVNWGKKWIKTEIFLVKKCFIFQTHFFKWNKNLKN